MGRTPSEEDGVCVNIYIVFLSQAVGKAVESGILGQSFFTQHYLLSVNYMHGVLF